MPDVTELTPGQVLADAEIAEFIKAMGLGIAEAQRALDENSVNQIPIFVAPQPGLGGRSLLDLGLSPAFYHYQSADISVSLNISLRIQKNTGFDLGLNFGLNDAKTTTSSNSDTKTESSSGTTSDTQHREAKLNVKVTTDGALNVGGKQFQLAGSNPLAIIDNLGDQLRGDSASGVSRALVIPNTTAVNPECVPPAPDLVITSPNAVAFMNRSSSEAVIRIKVLPAGATEDFTLKTGTTATADKKADRAAYANEVAAKIVTLGYGARAVTDKAVLETLHFDHDKANIDQAAPFEARTNRDKLVSLAAKLKGSGIKVRVLGLCDRSGPAKYNKNDLAKRRIDSVLNELRVHGVLDGQLAKPNIVTIASDVEQKPGEKVRDGDNIGEDRWAVQGKTTSQKDGALRIAEIVLDGNDADYVFVTGDAGHAINKSQVKPDRLANPASDDNGFVFVGQATSNVDLTTGGRKIVIKQTDFPLKGDPPPAGSGFAAHSPEAYALSLANDVNANQAVQVKAWATGNVCNLANSGDNFELLLVTSESREIELKGTSDVVVTSQFTKTQTIAKQETATGNRTVAVGATVGVRFSKQFDQTVTGNSTISAKLVSIPAPPEFLDQIKTFLTP